MISINALDEWRIVVPLRFTRAVHGQSIADAPDVDDRGYHMRTRPGVWGTTTTRGPMFGVTVGTRPSLNMATLFHRVQAIWNPCGVQFRMGPHVNDDKTLASNLLNTCDLTVDADITGILGLQRARLHPVGAAAAPNDQTLNM